MDTIKERYHSKFSALGPGLLFAATCVGTSHLVQSTRAGALYGLGLLLIVLMTNLIKYPAFRFASDYYPATGTSLLEAYRQQGKPVLFIFFLITLTTLLFGVSVLALMSAGLIKVVFSLTVSSKSLALILIAVTSVILTFGQYKVLERIIKVLIILMVVCTLIATVIVLPDIQWKEGVSLLPADLNYAGLMFIAALVGWMPIPLDASVWQSLWSKAKAENSTVAPSVKDSRFDFNVGYFGTMILAVAFLFMGAGLIYGKGIVLASSSSAFSAQLISLYEAVFGSFVGPIVGMAALAIIYSSLLSLMDAFPRTLSALYRRWLDIAEAEDEHKINEADPFYVGVLLLMFVLAALTYQYFMTSLTGLLDIAATTAFVMAPIIAYLNHRSITSNIVPKEYQPSGVLKVYSQLCIAAMTCVALGYLFIRFISNLI